MSRLRWWGAVLLGIVASAMLAQTPKDPVNAAASAIDRKDFISAEKILVDYLGKNPKSINAMLLLGMARLDLKNFDGAIDAFTTLLKDEPKDWYAHIGLAQAYAQKEDWPDFDKERALIKAARDGHAPGIQLIGDGDVIDILTVGDKQYTVKSYYTPVGPHHTHYVFLHIVGDVKVTDLFTCDSDDGDQIDFRNEYPKEAAAGARRFSLDPWVVTDDGNLVHGHVIALFDGEPPYEELRADVLKVLTARERQKDGKSIQ